MPLITPVYRGATPPAAPADAAAPAAAQHAEAGLARPEGTVELLPASPARRDGRRRGGQILRALLFRPKTLRGMDHPAARDPRYRRLFPWREPGNQLAVHPELADPSDCTRVDPRLRLLSLQFDKANLAQIRYDIAFGLFPPPPSQALSLTPAQRDEVVAREALLRGNLQEAVLRVMRAEEPVPPEEVYVRALGQTDLDRHEAALSGQCGLFTRRRADGGWRVVTEGLHLCFFGGVYCRSREEYETECARYSKQEVAAYALSIGEGDTRYPTISPYGGGDLGQFANAALAPDARGRLVEDSRRINTRFARVHAVFADDRPGGNGRRLDYPIAFLYMLAAADDRGEPEREARVGYGEAYWNTDGRLPRQRD